MSTPLQRRSARLNAKKSTGPRTPEGKCRSSRNALRFPSLAGPLPGVRLAELSAKFCREIQPRTPAEQDLVAILAAARLKLLLIRDLESQILSSTRSFRDLTLLLRHESRAQLCFLQAWDALIQLRKASQEKENHIQTDIQASANQVNRLHC